MLPAHKLIQCLAAAAAGLVLVLSWIPDSRLGQLPLFPTWFGAWLDQGGVVATMRTGVAMAVAAGLIHAARWMKSPWVSVVVAGLLLAAAEAGQLLLPSRQASVGDLTWGAAGIIIGVGVTNMLCRFRHGPDRPDDSAPADRE